jgi:two-component system nitrogen regulation sensor histidine kinase NtrY
MQFWSDPRRRITAILIACLLVFIGFGILQAFNTSKIPLLNPETSGETLNLATVTFFFFLVLLLLLMLLLRNILKVYSEQSTSALGARLRTRMVVGAAIIALTPAVCMFLFSFQLMNRSIDRWFSPNTSELRDNSTRVVEQLVQYVTGNARSEAESIAAAGAPDLKPDELQSVLVAHRITLEGGFVMVYGKDDKLVTTFQAPAESSPASLIPWLDEDHGKAIALHGALSKILLAAARRNDESVIRIGGQDYALAMALTASGKPVVASLPMPQGLSQTATQIRANAAEYWQLFRTRHRLRDNFFLALLILTSFVFFSSIWIAQLLSKQITRPVEALADAMDEIADGKYEQRVAVVATGEMGDLVRAFNHMAADLEESRRLADSSSAQLTAANQAIEERRRELETIVETIPSGVVTLDGAGVVLQSNRAFAALLGLPEDAILKGERIATVMPAECIDDLTGVIRRGQRMGAASTAMEFQSHGRNIHLAVTSARLELTRGQTGSVLVVEDTTDLLRAQRQLAWKEVAQRVAHEIRNPLTPIALSAERIARHLDRGQIESPNIIRKCSEVILGCVGTLRTLVDQFSALAQFPASQPRTCDLNQVVDQALALFAGRLEGITVKLDLESGLPMLIADPDAIRRALANLIDNAAEAMQGSLLRVLGVHTSLTDDGAAVEVAVSDTGHGLTNEIRERLFLPFYSTKNRGTGLGLSIAAKIVQEHGGSIRAEGNSPKGARFLMRLPLVETNGQPPIESVNAAKAEPVVKGLR